MTFQTASGAAHPSGTFHLCDRTGPPRTDEAQGIERFEHFTLPLCAPAVSPTKGQTIEHLVSNRNRRISRTLNMVRTNYRVTDPQRFLQPNLLGTPESLMGRNHRRGRSLNLVTLLRRGIGALVHDTGSNATRGFSAPAEAFRAGTDCSVLMWRLMPSSSHFRLVTATLISPFGPCSERLSTLPGHVAPDAPSGMALFHFPTLGRSISTKGGATNSPHTSEIAAGRSIGPSRRLESVKEATSQWK